MLDLLAQRTQIAQGAKLTGSRLDGIRVALRHKWLIVRSSALGAALGILPGIGGSVIDWIAYGVTKQTMRDNENFGKGDIRGVIGPESANNAKEGGALVRSEEHTSELQSLMRISYAVFCLKKKKH